MFNRQTKTHEMIESQHLSNMHEKRDEGIDCKDKNGRFEIKIVVTQ